MTPDLAARQILCAAYLYYVLDQPTMDDATYDRLSVYVSENWEELHPDRKFCCGSAQATRSSGSHFKFTTIAIHAARHLLWSRGGKPRLPQPRLEDCLFDPQVGHYVTAIGASQ